MILEVEEACLGWRAGVDVLAVEEEGRAAHSGAVVVVFEFPVILNAFHHTIN